jgi:hypothetical protein
MITFINANPYVKITHTLFDSYEYIYSKEDGNVYDENGNLFETFDDTDFMHIGLRLRKGDRWDNDWYVKGCKYHLQIPTVGLCCEAYYLSKGYRGCQQRCWMHFPFCAEHNCPLKHPELLKGATLEEDGQGK